VALIPRACDALGKVGISVLVEHSAGLHAGFTDEMYAARGAQIVSREDLFARADVVTQVRLLGANPEAGREDLPLLRPGQTVIGMGEPLTALSEAGALANAGVTSFAMELIPRITRAQSMDVLSAMSTIAGYEAVLLAATALSKIFPMLMTAAGTLAPVKAFVLGAGVAGLQAIATARRLGAVVSGYDVRAVVKEQVESVGAKFVVLEVETGPSAEDKGGYAKAMGEDFYRRQAELLGAFMKDQDVVITTAAVPGKKAPVLVNKAMVEGMMPGSVIIDLAAERGGNCELTRPGERIMHGEVTVWGPLNVPSLAPHDASQMFSSNLTSFLKLLVKDGQLVLNREDEIIRETLVTHGGAIVHPRIAELAGITTT
jgi:NAD(P) transhydrogenase subunit alpha